MLRRLVFRLHRDGWPASQRGLRTRGVTGRGLETTDAGWEPAALVSRLYRLFSVEERVHLITEGSATAVFSHLRQLELSEEQVAQLVLQRPQLLRRGPSHWRTVSDTLLTAGLSRQQLADALAACPALLGASSQQLEATLSVLFSELSAADPALLQLVCSQPQLLLLPSTQLRRQLAEIRARFSSQQTTRIVLRCPSVLTDSLAEITGKIDYLIDTMGLTPMDIAHSSGLAHSLQHIRTRHQFLYRSGTYIRPNPKDTAPSKNPSLTEIVDQSDDVFCQRVARMPHRDYEVFERMLLEEVEEVDEERSSDEEHDEDLADSYRKHSYGKRKGR